MNLDTVTKSFNSVVSTFINFIPSLISGVVLIILGLIIAAIIRSIVNKVLQSLNFDALADRVGIGRFVEATGVNADPIKIISSLVYWLVFLIFLNSALIAMHITAFSQILNALYLYIPQVVAAVIILLVGLAAANFLADIIRGLVGLTRTGFQNILADLTKIVIMLFTILAALQQLNIATSLLNILFSGIVIAMALGVGLAVGISFGLGGRDLATQSLTMFLQSIRSSTPVDRNDRRTKK